MAWQSESMAPMPADVSRPGGGILPYLIGLLIAGALGLSISVYDYKPLMLLIGIVVGAVVLWRPYVGFLLVVASLPADVTGVIGGSTSSVVLSITKMLGVLTLTATVFDHLVHQRVPSLRRMITPEMGLIVLFTLATAASGLVHWTRESLSEILRQVTILVFILITVHFVDRPSRVAQVFRVAVASATAVAINSIIQRGSGLTSVSEEWVAEAGAVLDVGEEAVGQMVRTTGTFSHPAWLGLFLSLTIPMTLYIVWTTQRRFIAAAGLVSIGIQILGIFSTYSRMAYIGAALGVVLFVLRRRFGPALLIALVLGSMAVFPTLPNEVQARVYSILEYQKSSSSLTRIGQQMAGWAMFRAHPFTGVGPGNFEAHAVEYGNKVPEPYHVEPIGAHNMYVQIAAELGAPGLILAGCLLALCLWEVRRLRRRAVARGDRKEAILWECLCVALLVFLVSAMFVHAQYRKEWWLLVALIAAGRTFRRGTTEPVPVEIRQS